tara:strand:- start:1326 stop:2597 length:1272 start_codon:yes stop_codon:yes gene_type:complete
MAETYIANTTDVPKKRKHAVPFLIAVAWRNLWRNRRRTWLMSSAIAFASFLVTVAASFQGGIYDDMIDLSSRFYTGHAQLQHPDYQDNPRVKYTITDAATKITAIEKDPLVRTAVPRVIGHGLVSIEESSLGALIIGVDPQREFLTIQDSIQNGRYLQGRGEVVIGSLLARNLDGQLGDDLVMLGSGKEGSVAALAGTIVGFFETGVSEIDRGQVHVDYRDYAEALEISDEVHSIALLLDHYSSGETMATAGTWTEAGDRFLSWIDLSPHIKDLIDVKAVSSNMMYGLLGILVIFGVVNACIMTVLDRTREFGMLIAVGMRPLAIIYMLQLEILWMTVVGLGLGFALSGGLLGLFMWLGIPLPESYDELAQGFHMPEVLVPGFSVVAYVWISVSLLLATQAACVLSSVRLFRLKVVEALATEE